MTMPFEGWYLMVPSLERITYIIIFIPCMKSVLCVEWRQENLSELVRVFFFSLLCSVQLHFKKILCSEVLVLLKTEQNMHSYKAWLKNYRYVTILAITRSLLSKHFSVSYLYQCKCIVLYVQFFWDSIMKWRGFINSKNNNNKKITVTFYVYV